MMNILTRALWLSAVLFSATASGQTPSPPDSGVDFARIKALATERAMHPFVSRREEWAPFWKDLGGHDHAKIKFRREQALWHGDQRPFEVEMLHPGGPWHDTTKLAEVVKGNARDIPWNADFFDYDDLAIPESSPPPQAFGGFRVLMPLDKPGTFDDWAVFEAGNLFRCIAPSLKFGLSARGLAINPGDPSGEESPVWERFWLIQPQPNARAVEFFSLLDSPSVCGAYRFRITPGRATVMEVEAEITPRQPVALLGLAPLSSMCWFSEMAQPKPQDYRPEVHESDGLLINIAEGNVLWIPLDTGKTLRHAEFPLDALLGFGLMQRDRQFASYEDLEAGFQLRPSAYIEPVGRWPAGKIHVYEQPTTDEHFQNVTACWQPGTPLKAGQAFQIGYRLHWLNEMSVPGISRVLGSRRTQTNFPTGEKRPDSLQFVVDFSQAAKEYEDPNQIVLTAEVGEGAKLVGKSVLKNPETGGWRAFIDVQIAPESQSFQSNCRLLGEGRPISERWIYQWTR